MNRKTYGHFIKRLQLYEVEDLGMMFELFSSRCNKLISLIFNVCMELVVILAKGAPP